MILGGLALKLGEAGVEAGVLRQDRGDQESNLRTEHRVNPNHRGRGHIWLHLARQVQRPVCSGRIGEIRNPTCKKG